MIKIKIISITEHFTHLSHLHIFSMSCILSFVGSIAMASKMTLPDVFKLNHKLFHNFIYDADIKNISYFLFISPLYISPQYYCFSRYSSIFIYFTMMIQLLLLYLQIRYIVQLLIICRAIIKRFKSTREMWTRRSYGELTDVHRAQSHTWLKTVRAPLLHTAPLGSARTG